MGKALGAGLQWMHDAGVLATVLPELDATVDFSQEGGRRHKDVWEHTKLVVLQSAPSPIVRWSALLHDIGKVRTRVMLPDGKVTFHRHAEVGARMFEPIAKRLGVRQARAPPDPVPDHAPPARERVRAQLDRRRRAPVRSRDGRAPGQPARAVAAPT